MFETLQEGLEERRQKKEEVQRLIQEEELIAPTRSVEDPLSKAESAFKRGNYLESLVRTSTALELALEEALRKKM